LDGVVTGYDGQVRRIFVASRHEPADCEVFGIFVEREQSALGAETHRMDMDVCRFVEGQVVIQAADRIWIGFEAMYLIKMAAEIKCVIANVRPYIEHRAARPQASGEEFEEPAFVDSVHENSIVDVLAWVKPEADLPGTLVNERMSFSLPRSRGQGPSDLLTEHMLDEKPGVPT
jgi:hypothetical protein